MAAWPSIRASGGGNGGSTTQFNVAIPPEAQAGDMMLVMVYGISSDPAGMQGPAGWTELFDDVTFFSSERYALYYKILDAGDLGSTPQFFGTSGGYNAYSYLVVYDFDPSVPLTDVWWDWSSGNYVKYYDVATGDAPSRLIVGFAGRVAYTSDTISPAGCSGSLDTHTLQLGYPLFGNRGSVWTVTKGVEGSHTTTTVLCSDTFNVSTDWMSLSLCVRGIIPPGVQYSYEGIGGIVVGGSADVALGTNYGSEPDAGWQVSIEIGGSIVRVDRITLRHTADFHSADLSLLDGSAIARGDPITVTVIYGGTETVIFNGTVDSMYRVGGKYYVTADAQTPASAGEFSPGKIMVKTERGLRCEPRLFARAGDNYGGLKLTSVTTYLSARAMWFTEVSYG